MLIYVAHKFENKMENFNLIQDLLYELNVADVNNTYISPITIFGSMYTDLTYEEGMLKCFDLLDRADMLLLLGDWEMSIGCKREVEHVLATTNIPIISRISMQADFISDDIPKVLQNKDFINKYLFI